MATLGQIISRMRAAGESEEDIAATRAEYEKINTPKPRPSLFDNQMAGLELPRGNPEPTSPTDFWGGFGESLRSGEALETGLRGAAGFARGAIADLPNSVAGALRTGAGLMSFGNPERQVEAGRELFEGLAALPGHVAESIRFAPTRPEEFGRTAGQLMGQPAAAELAGIGALGAARGLRRPAANLMSSVGRGLEGAKPVQGMPVTPKGAISSVVRASVAPTGRMLQRGGEALRKQALAYEGAKAAEGAGINLKEPIPTTEGEPMGGGMGITRPRVTRQEGPGPTRINQNTEVNRPIADTFEHYPGGPSGPKRTTPPPSIPAEPPASQVAPGSQPPVVETTGDVAARQRYQNRSLYPERTPRPTPPIPEAPGEVIPESQPPILEDLQSRAARTPEAPPSAFTEPVPSEADPMFQSDLETFETNPGGTSNVNTAPSAFPSEPIPISDVDPMFRSEPTPPPGSRLVRPTLTPEEELTAAVEAARRELTQEPSVGFQPDPFSLGEPAPPTQPRVTVKAPKTPRDYEGLSLEELEAELAARKAGKPSTLKPKAKAESEPAKAAPEPKPEPPKAEAAPEAVDTTTGEITEPTPPPLRAKRLKGKWNLFKSSEPGRSRPYGGYEEGSAEIPKWADKVASIFDRKPGTNPNRSMFERSARIGAEEAAAARPQSQFSDAVPGANEFSPDLVAQSENIFEGTSPKFGKRGVAEFKTKAQVETGKKFESAKDSLENLRESMPEEARLDSLRKTVDELTAKEAAGTMNKYEPAVLRTLKEYLSKFMKDESGEIRFDKKPVREVSLQGKKFPVYTADDFKTLREQYEIRPAYLSETMPSQGKPKDLIYLDMAGENRPHKIVGPAKTQRPGVLEDERGAIGLDIGPEGKGSAKPGKSENLAGRLVKSGEYTKVKAKDVGPKGGAFRVEDPSGKHLGDIVVTPEEVAAMKAHEGGVLEDVPDNLLAQELYKNKFDEMMEKHGIREDALTRVKVTTKSNRTKNVEDATAPPKEKPKAKAVKTEAEPEEKIKIDKPGKSVQPPIATPASFEGMPRSYKLKDRTNIDAIQAGRRKGYHLTYNKEGEVVMVRGDLIESETMAKAPETAKAEPAPVKAERTGLDPDKAFAPGGDPEPIREAIFQLRSVGAADNRYKPLLPSNMQGPLQSGETWHGRVVKLFTHPTKEEIAKKAEIAKFIESVESTRESQPRPVEAKPVEEPPLLRSKTTKFTPRPPKAVRNSPFAGNKNWISPRQEEMLRQMRKKHGE